MRTIEIEEDVYDYLRRITELFGEDHSSILRRVLKLPSTNDGGTGRGAPSTSRTQFAQVDQSSKELLEFLGSPELRARRKATDKFLRILSRVCRAQGKNFEKVLQISGRRRVYFGRNEEEVKKSGTSTHPRQIPNSSYWVMTNADTDQKKEMLSRVLTVLGYSPEIVNEATKAL